MDVGQIHGDGDDVFHFEACGLDHLFDVVECGFGFGGDASGGQLVGLVGAFLSGDVECFAGDDAVAERKASVGERLMALCS